MPRPRSSLAQRRDAWELAQTPVTNPYRDQFVDPFAPAELANAGQKARPGASFELVPHAQQAAPAAATEPATPAQPSTARHAAPAGWPTGRVKTPAAAGWAAAFGFVLGAVLALFGVMVIAWISLQKELGPDRSFHSGGDAADLLIGLIDLTLACTYLISSSALASGRINGRIGLTAAGWTTLFLSAYWWQSDRNIPLYVPGSVAAAALVMMVLAYMPRVTRWLGVLPVPQPE